MQEDRLHVFTQARAFDEVEQRHAALVEDFARACEDADMGRDDDFGTQNPASHLYEGQRRIAIEGNDAPNLPVVQ